MGLLDRTNEPETIRKILQSFPAVNERFFDLPDHQLFALKVLEGSGAEVRPEPPALGLQSLAELAFPRSASSQLGNHRFACGLCGFCRRFIRGPVSVRNPSFPVIPQKLASMNSLFSPHRQFPRICRQSWDSNLDPPPSFVHHATRDFRRPAANNLGLLKEGISFPRS